MIVVNHLRKEFGSIVPLKDINTVINDGEIISIIGPSGTGKSVFIRCLNRLETPTSGQILVDGVDITDHKCRISDIRKKMGMVFQSFNLFENMSVIRNVMQPPMDILGISSQDAYDRGMEILQMVGMESRADQYPDMLSGGQKQRVAIARTLSMDPDVILFDEPTSALDPAMVGEVQAIIARLAKMGKTLLIVTHDMDFARAISTRIFYLDQGIIYEDGTPEEIFEHPKKERTHRFVNSSKCFDITINSKDYDFQTASETIIRYGYNKALSPRVMYKLQAAFEELCQQILLPALPSPKINFYVTHDESQNRMRVAVQYNGETFDPEDTDNKLSLSILNGFITDSSYRRTEEEEYGNLFEFALEI